MTEVWTRWEGEVIQGTFPLRRLLGSSDHSAVFLTGNEPQALPAAAIKIIAAPEPLMEAQLSQWRAAARLSHPHLLRLIDAGRCELEGRPFLFLVMEQAEQTLSEILPHRALTAEELRDMLSPTLDALAFLHGKNLVHGRLQPSNILVVDDQLKLASDAIHPASQSAVSAARSSSYDPPEATGGGYSAAGDIWALGMTVVEALTQCSPARPDERSEVPALPPGLPAAFADSIRRCLSRDPAGRPTVTELEAQLNGAPPPPAPAPAVAVAVAAAVVEPAARQTTVRAARPAKLPKQFLLVAIVMVLLGLSVWFWTRHHLIHSSPRVTAATPPQIPLASTTAPPATLATPPPERPAPPAPEGSPFVRHEEIPDVPRSASDTIHGRFNVTVRVSVDRSGNVVDETLENAGPSRYFARLATVAAKKWQFAPADDHNPRQWLLRFEFTRGGVSAHAAPPP